MYSLTVYRREFPEHTSSYFFSFCTPDREELIQKLADEMFKEALAQDYDISKGVSYYTNWNDFIVGIDGYMGACWASGKTATPECLELDDKIDAILAEAYDISEQMLKDKYGELLKEVQEERNQEAKAKLLALIEEYEIPFDQAVENIQKLIISKK